MLKSAFDIRQKTHNMIEMSRRNYEYAILNRCVFRLLLKMSMDWAHLMVMGSACQNLPGDNEVSSRDVYPQIVETTRVCRATVVMTSKVEPCHVEPCRPATRSCNLFCTQLAASVDLSILVLCGHISAVRRQCAQHYSGSVVAETLSIHWYHTEGCCNNPNGMSLLNLSFFQSWVCQGTFEFYRWNTADS